MAQKICPTCEKSPRNPERETCFTCDSRLVPDPRAEAREATAAAAKAVEGGVIIGTSVASAPGMLLPVDGPQYVKCGKHVLGPGSWYGESLSIYEPVPDA